MNRRMFTQLAAAAAITTCFSVPGHAQSASEFPNRPVRLIVPYAPGGLPDTVARLIGKRLSDRTGQPVTVDNRPGANGVVAAQALMSSPADGYTLLVTDGSMMSINPQLNKNLPYDQARDFMPVSLVARAPLFLAVHTGVPANTLQEFVALAKSKGGSMNYGSSGLGSTHHLSMEAMKGPLGIEMLHVPFRGTGQSVPALIGKQVEVLFSALPSLTGFVKSGQVKLLATNSAQRSSQAPNVPAISEIIPGFDFAPIVGVLAPTGTPQAVVQRLSEQFAQITKIPEVVQTMATAGIEAIGSTPAEYAAAIKGENERYAKAIPAAGLKAQ
ncbi:MAG: tripartite tricarboxylate transporter substrate binding protein [Pseudomonadota bacterium]